MSAYSHKQALGPDPGLALISPLHFKGGKHDIIRTIRYSQSERPIQFGGRQALAHGDVCFVCRGLHDGRCARHNDHQLLDRLLYHHHFNSLAVAVGSLQTGGSTRG